MGNATEDVKSQARLVTLGNARDFLWRSLDEHGRRALTQAFSAGADGLQAAYTLIVAA